MDQIHTYDIETIGLTNDIQSDFYGKNLAVASSDGCIYIYETSSQPIKLKTKIENAHEGGVWKVDYSHPMFGSLLVSGGFDRKVNLWKEAGNIYDKLFEYNEHTNSVTCVAFSNASKDVLLFGSGCLDGNIALHQYRGDNFYTEKIKAHNFGVNNISFSKTNPLVFASCGNDKLIKIWTYQKDTGNWVPEIKDAPDDSITTDIAFRENDVTDSFATCNEDGMVYYWKKHGEEWAYKPVIEYTEAMVKVSWNDNGNMLVAVSSDGKEHIVGESELGN